MKSILLIISMLFLSLNVYADHSILELEGSWHSSLFPDTDHYEFKGINSLDDDKYLIHHTRGHCIGSGIFDLQSGVVRTIEICPPQNGSYLDSVFINEWQISVDHDDLHLAGGYWAKGSSRFRPEDLDKNHDH